MYPAFGKIQRWNTPINITEKIDGTNGLVYVFDPTKNQDEKDLAPYHVTWAKVDDQEFGVAAGSRKRWLAPGNDNHEFAQWVSKNAEGLARLGYGCHYGEWWGSRINRGYGLVQQDRRFSLFNATRWADITLGEFGVRGLGVVPILWTGTGDDLEEGIEMVRSELFAVGSRAMPGYAFPEGFVINHEWSRSRFKVVLRGDEKKKVG